jgi:hypothetical protein
MRICFRDGLIFRVQSRSSVHPSLINKTFHV